MPVRSLFLNTANLQLSDYDRSRNVIQINNFQPGIGTIEKIYLTSFSAPTYLLYKSSINISMSLGELDDKFEVIKENDHYLYSSFFAKILPQINIQSYNLNWYKRGVFTYGNEIILDNENYRPNDSESHSEIQYHVASKDILLNTLVIGEGVRTFTSSITELGGGFSFSGGVADDTFTIVPGLMYVFDVTSISSEWTLMLSFTGLMTDYSTEEQAAFINCLVQTDPNTYHLFVPKTKFNSKTSFNFHYTRGDEEHVTEHLYSPDTYSSYKIRMFKNGNVFLDKIVFVSANTTTTSLCILPYFLSTRPAPFFASNGFHYGDLLRVNKGDVLSFSLTPQDVEFTYEPSLPVKTHKHVQANVNARNIENMHTTLVIDNVEYVLYKKNDLVYTAPNSESQLTTVSNLSMEFFNNVGANYPIFTLDDIQLSLEFATTILK